MAGSEIHNEKKSVNKTISIILRIKDNKDNMDIDSNHEGCYNITGTDVRTVIF
jgi:hypothetical protein